MNWSMVKPDLIAPVNSGTALRTTGPEPVDSRQLAPSVATARPDEIGPDPMSVEGINGRLRGNREESFD